MVLGILCSPHLAVAHCFGMFHWCSNHASLLQIGQLVPELKHLCVLSVRSTVGWEHLCVYREREMINCLEFQCDKTDPFIDGYSNLCRSSKWQELDTKVTH